MGKRLLDVGLSAIALIVAAPLLALAVVGIRLASSGPILYRAERVGRGGKPFRMYKLRTMHVAPSGNHQSVITGQQDPRVFAFGAWLRRTKLDELPQLYNVLRREMSIVGPRPEDPRIVAHHYGPVHLETLRVPPGLASPGSIYYYTHGERQLAGPDPEARYVRELLPLKVALDVVYVRRASLWYDAAIVGRTIWVLLASLAGKRHFRDPPELEAARRLLLSDPAGTAPASPDNPAGSATRL